MIRVVLAEKPDQAREYAKALGESEFKGGRLIVKQSPYIDGEIWIVSARGLSAINSLCAGVLEPVQQFQ